MTLKFGLMTQINSQWPIPSTRSVCRGNGSSVFIKKDTQSKLMNTTTMIPSRRILKRDLAITYVPFRRGGDGYS